MLDIKDIKMRKQYYKDCFKKRAYEVDLDNLIELYDRIVRSKQEQEDLLAKRNKGAKTFDTLRRNGEDTQNLQDQLKKNAQRITQLTEQLTEFQEQYNKIFFALPNIVMDGTPAGGKEANVVLKTFKEKPTFAFKPKTHIQLCKELNLIDYDRAIKLAGEGKQEAIAQMKRA